MTVYNNETTLAQAITSILSQTFSDFVFYIVDDCSSDESPRILAKFAKKDNRIKIITNQHHLGLTKSLNKALRQVKTPLISRMDADDISFPTRLAKQLQYMTSHSDIVLLGTAAYLIDSQGKQVGLKTNPQDHQHIRANILKYCPFIHPTWLVRREIIFDLDGYDDTFPFAQDYELALRIVAKYQTANLSEPLLYYRVNTASAISLKNLKTQEKLALKARWLALTKYHYPKSEVWKLIKPLLSFLVPVGIKKAVYRQFFWSGCLIFSLLVFSGCQSAAPQPVINEPSASPSAAGIASPVATTSAVTKPTYTNWKYYSNETFRYKLRHPFDWSVINQNQNPGVVTFSNVAEDKLSAPHVIFIATAAKKGNYALANFPAVTALTDQGRESRQLVIANSAGLFFSSLGEGNDIFSIFIDHNDYILNLTWNGTAQDVRNQYKDICLQIAASLEFF